MFLTLSHCLTAQSAGRTLVSLLLLLQCCTSTCDKWTLHSSIPMTSGEKMRTCLLRPTWQATSSPYRLKRCCDRNSNHHWTNNLGLKKKTITWMKRNVKRSKITEMRRIFRYFWQLNSSKLKTSLMGNTSVASSASWLTGKKLYRMATTTNKDDVNLQLSGSAKHSQYLNP